MKGYSNNCIICSLVGQLYVRVARGQVAELCQAYLCQPEEDVPPLGQSLFRYDDRGTLAVLLEEERCRAVAFLVTKGCHFM